MDRSLEETAAPPRRTLSAEPRRRPGHAEAHLVHALGCVRAKTPYYRQPRGIIPLVQRPKFPVPDPDVSLARRATGRRLEQHRPPCPHRLHDRRPHCRAVTVAAVLAAWRQRASLHRYGRRDTPTPHRATVIAPMTKTLRRLIFDMLPGRALPPVECRRDTRPSRAENPDPAGSSRMNSVPERIAASA